MVAEVIESSPDEIPLLHLQLYFQPLAKTSQGVTEKRGVDSVRKMFVGVDYAWERPYSGTA